MEIQKKKKIGNCKELAHLLTSFNIELAEKPLEEMFEKMTEFLFTSSKGFFCAICDYKM